MAASSQPQLLIRRAYMLLFGREPTDMQIRFWLIRMQVGLSPADFLSAVAADPMCDAPGAREDLAKLRAAKLAAQVWPNSLLRRMDKGEIAPDTLVWQAGMSDWQRADEAMPLVAKRVEAALTHPKPPARIGKEFALYASLR